MSKYTKLTNLEVENDFKVGGVSAGRGLRVLTKSIAANYTLTDEEKKYEVIALTVTAASKAIVSETPGLATIVIVSNNNNVTFKGKSTDSGASLTKNCTYLVTVSADGEATAKRIDYTA